MLKRVQVDNLEKLIGQLDSLHVELTALAKKSPNDAVNNFKLSFVNTTIGNCNKLLGKKYKPFEDFDQFDTDDVPSNSDLTFIIAQYMQALEKFRSDNLTTDSLGRWVYDLEDSEENIRTTTPAKLRKK